MPLISDISGWYSDNDLGEIAFRGLTDFLYQRDGEIIAFARPDLAVVAGTDSSSVALAVDIRAMSAV